MLRVTPASVEAAKHCNEPGHVTAIPTVEGSTPVQLAVTPGEPLRLDLDFTHPWRLAVEVPGCWAPDTLLQPTALPPELVIALWRAGAVTGRLVTERHQEIPATLNVRLTPAPDPTDAERPPVASITCPVKEARFTCRLPAERLDLRIAAEDFIPEYRWDVVVAPGATRELGEISLERGASLAGWVVMESSRPERPRVQLVPEVVGGSGTPTGDRLSSRALTADATDRGFFHLRGVAPGSYRLRATATGTGTAERAPVVVEERREHVLDEPLMLEPLAQAVVSVDPPVGPDLQPWTIKLRREIPLSSMYQPVKEGPVDEHGVWSQAGLESGRYLVEVLDSNGSSHFRQELDLDSRTRPLAVALSLVPVRGTLRAGELPLSRKVWFERWDGLRVQMVSDESGALEGVLPEEGIWKVRIAPVRGRGQRWLEDQVEVVRAKGDTWAEVAIELPATHLVGEVLDSDRQPVAGALVRAYGRARPLAEIFTRGDGSFEIHGLPAGEIQVRAEARGNLESALMKVEVGADEEPSPLELIVREQRALRGRVVLNGRPLAGASVHYQVPGAPLAQTLHANPQGMFRLWLPAWVETLDVVVLSPGLPTKLARIQVPTAGADLPPLELQTVSGELAIRLPSDSPSLYIRGEGSFVPIWSLFLGVDRGRLRGFDESTGILHLPLEPGSYTICPSPEESRRCEGGYLAPGGSLMLDFHRGASDERETRERRGI